METLAERLKYVLYKLDLNQVEAARLIGISQQSINYILRNNLNTSRLSVRIAEGLQINPEWLLTGKGEWQPEKINKIPIINDNLILQLYFRDNSLTKDTKYILSNRDLGKKPFAVQIEDNKLCICTRVDEYKEKDSYLKDDYLYINDCEIKISKKDTNNPDAGYKVIEWRIYDIKV